MGNAHAAIAHAHTPRVRDRKPIDTRSVLLTGVGDRRHGRREAVRAGRSIPGRTPGDHTRPHNRRLRAHTRQTPARVLSAGALRLGTRVSVDWACVRPSSLYNSTGCFG